MPIQVEQCRLPGLAVHLSLDHKLGGSDQERVSKANNHMGVYSITYVVSLPIQVEQCRLPGLAVHLSLDHKLGGSDQESLKS